MSEKIKIGIVGYGNLGRGVEHNIKNSDDMELVAIFSRRDKDSLATKSPTYSYDELVNFRDRLDVLILCGGSHKDLPIQGPELARDFNTVDSYDNHSNIPNYFESMDKVAKASDHTSIISIGWDPGLFSLNRLLFQSILPQGDTYSFWGKGVSQGHSQIVRSVEGVKYGVQYTIPKEEALEKVRTATGPELSPGERHRRVCYIVSEDKSQEERIAEEIKNIEGYFKEYDTEVYFIDEEEFIENHGSMPHGGRVIHSAKTSEDIKHNMEFVLDLEHNPEFTSSVLIAYARACYRLAKEKKTGAHTIFDIPLSYLTTRSDHELRKNLL